MKGLGWVDRGQEDAVSAVHPLSPEFMAYIQ